MKYIKSILSILLILSIAFLGGCSSSDDDTNPVDDGNGDNNDQTVTTVSTQNVKNDGPQYYTFSSKTLSADANTNFDIQLDVKLNVIFMGAMGWTRVYEPVIVVGDLKEAEIYFEGMNLYLGYGNEVYAQENSSIDTVTVKPSGEYHKDTLPEYVTAGWYDFLNFEYVPRSVVYVIKTQDNKYAALIVTDYYDAENESGAYTFDWKYVE